MIFALFIHQLTDTNARPVCAQTTHDHLHQLFLNFCSARTPDDTLKPRILLTDLISKSVFFFLNLFNGPLLLKYDLKYVLRLIKYDRWIIIAVTIIWIAKNTFKMYNDCIVSHARMLFVHGPETFDINAVPRNKCRGRYSKYKKKNVTIKFLISVKYLVYDTCYVI